MESAIDRVNTAVSDVYADVRRIWEAEKSELQTWELGFKILYSPPAYRPKLLIIGLNPGCNDGQTYSPGEHAGWPQHNEYSSQSWKLATTLQRRFETIAASDALKQCVGMNVNFFRSHSSQRKIAGLRWQDNPPAVRKRLEDICLVKVHTLIAAMQPRLVIALGISSFDALTAKTGNITLLLRESDQNRLCAINEVANANIVGIIHPTGAQASKGDWGRIMEIIGSHIGS